MPKRALSDAQLRRFLQILETRIVRVHGGKLSAQALELDIAQPSLWQIVKGKTGPSRTTVERLAALEGVSVETLLTSARERAAAIVREAASARLMGLDPGTTERAIAAVMAEHDD